MKKEQNKDNAITKTDLVFIVGLALFAYPTWIGLKFVHDDDVFSLLISMLYIALLCLFVYGLKKIKTVETNFKTWKWVEFFSLLVFIVSLLFFINVPMNRTFEVFSQKKYLKEQAEEELSNIEKVLKNYYDQEKKAITLTRDDLKKDVVTLSTIKDKDNFDGKLREYINFLVLSNEEGGEITEEKIIEYEVLLNDIFIKDKEGYIGSKKNQCSSMRRRNGWNIVDLYKISDYSVELDTLYKEVGKKLTDFSKSHHSDKDYPYKFVLEKSDNCFKIKEVLEYDYIIENGGKQSVFKTMFDNIIKDKNNFNIISLVIIIMILFPYLMANRSTKVTIKRMYDKNNKDLGGQDL